MGAEKQGVHYRLCRLAAVGVFLAALPCAALAASIDGSGEKIQVWDHSGDGSVTLQFSGVGNAQKPLYYSVNYGEWTPVAAELPLTVQDRALVQLALDLDGDGWIDADDYRADQADQAVMTYLGQTAGLYHAVLADWKLGELQLDLVAAGDGDSLFFFPLPGTAMLLLSGLGAAAFGKRRAGSKPQTN